MTNNLVQRVLLLHNHKHRDHLNQNLQILQVPRSLLLLLDQLLQITLLIHLRATTCTKPHQEADVETLNQQDASSILIDNEEPTPYARDRGVCSDQDQQIIIQNIA